MRGQRESLVLQKRAFANSLSTVRPSGLSAPPPLTVPEPEWQRFAAEHLQSNTVVHTDGAQAYCAPVQNLHLRHDSVSHSTKKGGPHFTKNCTHKGVKKAGKRKVRALQARSALTGPGRPSSALAWASTPSFLTRSKIMSGRLSFTLGKAPPTRGALWGASVQA